ncbi:hypothetical protein [Candidatus Viridilinea mediisalina]|uniref:Glycosyltransferase RgtA/B/C/D-like domain-containing protein n=1 Tax=Candidatus Viridilinea mediisalina TaxID=2024553 RepID=A0A2A6RQ09_9CHLR|nr:hypothetical protein [Candidatus Viridilinea mediisalina]PDW04950.1 hypothetical protein CJ255_00800 [Candidatus Viridilinea mediisalina]
MRSITWAIFWLLSGFYLLTMSGHTYSPDEETMLAVTRSMLARGEVAVRAEEVGSVAALRPGRDAERYSPYGVLPSLLALPLHMLGASLGGADAAARDYTSRFLVTALNGPITAATAALLAAWALRLGSTRLWAITLGLGYGLATMAWPYARSFFSEPLAALLILVAAERIHASATSSQPWRALMLAGLATGLLLTTRLAAGVVLPVFAVAVLLASWHRVYQGQTDPRHRFVRWSASNLVWLLALLPGLALLMWYNYARFGTLLASGYASEASLFTTPLLEGLYGLLLSPGKGIVFYAPPLLLAIPGSYLLWRRGQRGVVLLGWGLFLSHVLLYARWSVWDGGGVWGPRFLLPVVAPLLLLGAGYGLRGGREFLSDRELHHRGTEGTEVRKGMALKGLAVLLLLVGWLGNLGGVLLNFSTYGVMPLAADRVHSVAGAALVGHWRILSERWAAYRTAPPVCRLADGWFASEASDGAVLPRRSGAWGELHCNAPSARIYFNLDDRRPPEASASALRLTLNGALLAEPSSGELRHYQLHLPPTAASIRIEATPWNPLAVGFSGRNDELGPKLTELRGTSPDAQSLTLADTAIAPLPTQAKPRWAWYYDPPNQHLVDHWAWYLPRSELQGRRATLMASLLLLLGGGAMGVGAYQLYHLRL